MLTITQHKGVIKKINRKKGHVEINEKGSHIDRSRNGKIYCHLCGVDLPKIHEINEHINGFKHQKFQEVLNSFMKNSNALEHGSDLPTLQNLDILHDEAEYGHIEKLDESFTCTQCNTSLKTIVDVEKHLVDKNHKRNLILKSTPDSLWDIIKELECGKTDNIQKVSANKFKCMLCVMEFDYSSVVQHVGGTIHQLGLVHKEGKSRTNRKDVLTYHKMWNEIFTAEGGKFPNISRFSLDKFRCFICSKTLTENNVIPHIRSTSHKTAMVSHENVEKNLRLQKCFDDIWDIMEEAEKTHKIHFKIEQDRVMYCIPCNTKIPFSNLSEHIRGKSHMSTVMHYIITSPSTALITESIENLEKESTDKLSITECSSQEKLINALLVREDSVELKEFHCIVCNVRVKMERDWELHLNSSSHIRLVDNLLESDEELITHECEVCDATLYCVARDKNKHDCLMKLPEHNDVPNKTMKTDCSKNTQRIAVSGYASDVNLDKLYSCFKTYGRISYIAMLKDFAIIEFFDKSAKDNALTNPSTIKDVELKVENLESHMRKEDVLPVDEVHDEVVNLLKSVHNFEHKLEELCQLTQITSNPQNLHDICHFLETKLSSCFPDCKAYPFGSRVCGLAFPESDVDIFLDTGDMYDGKKRQEAEIQELIVADVHNVLYELPECRTVIGVPKARTPIVKFYHIPSGTQCDIAFRHGLGVENTELIRYYVSLDERIKLLILFIKYWAQTHDLIGPSKITNYALIWLIIFYLQQPSGFGLPSVETLERLHTGQELRIAGWQCSFSKDKNAVRTVKHSKSVLQLLRGFFVHYHIFEYSKYVVCPLVGAPVKRSFFSSNNINKLPEAMTDYIENIYKNKHTDKLRTCTCVCVQDPFDLCHNITKGLPATTLRKFKVLCGFSAELCNINN